MGSTEPRISRIEICEKGGEYAIAFFYADSLPSNDYFGFKLSSKDGKSIIREAKARGLIESTYSLEGANIVILRAGVN